MSKTHRLPSNEHHHTSSYGVQGGGAETPHEKRSQFVDHATDAPPTPKGQTYPNAPYAERHADYWLPERGQGPGVFHGVMPTELPLPHEDQYDKAQRSATAVAQFAEPPKHVEPVPVFLVAPETGSEQIGKWRGMSFTIDSSSTGPAIVLGKDMHRKRVLLLNTDAANSIRISSSESGVSTGAILPAGATSYLALYTQDMLYAYAAAGTPVLSIIVEYGVSE